MRDMLGKWLTGSDTDLFLHQVASVNLFRNRVLDLDPSVHLNEIKMPVLIDQELDRACVFIAHRLGQLQGSVSHFLSQTRCHERRWAFFDHFLVAPLNGTIAFAQMHHVTMTVGNNLKLDVMRIDDELLEINLFVAESFLGFVTRTVKG